MDAVTGTASHQIAAAAPVGQDGNAEQEADLHRQLQLYKLEREQLSKDVLFYKQSCKDMKRRLRAEVRNPLLSNL